MNCNRSESILHIALNIRKCYAIVIDVSKDSEASC